MCTSIAEKGWRPVVLNYRGCAGLQLTSPAVYCASFTDDVHLAVQEIHTQFPEARVFAAGYSLGSLILCKYLAECGNGTWKAEGVLVLADKPAMYSLQLITTSLRDTLLNTASAQLAYMSYPHRHVLSAILGSGHGCVVVCWHHQTLVDT